MNIRLTAYNSVVEFLFCEILGDVTVQLGDTTVRFGDATEQFGDAT